ncbi:NUDIX domain-containing protein [Fusibacter paucivorans]|uniref:8-oxo-dGTP diphosphatase n=1 Tax=Fusibacter paucivorans TaxID=76009 RepID=A0ABS5PNE9_9FIRM|nr:NUDIX domain-containing protein [Fusibacter paucivorans]MBS7525919.1 NUDIX domain-containing protein [Fusibacter paucivorans]
MELWDIYDANRCRTGKKVVRGVPLGEGEFHLVVFAVIMNAKGEIIVSKRTPNKTFPNHWEITGGAAVSGDDSESAVLREIKEELGITFKRGDGKRIKRFIQYSEFSYFGDIWLFKAEVDMASIICQPEEVSEVKRVDQSALLALLDSGVFIKNQHVIDCLKNLW